MTSVLVNSGYGEPPRKYRFKNKGKQIRAMWKVALLGYADFASSHYNAKSKMVRAVKAVRDKN